jgi:hypothetical protein
MALTLTDAQRLLLGIITSVEGGITEPKDAVEELTTLKAQAAKAGLTFRAEYTLEDFEKIHQNYVSEYDSSTPDVEYEESTSY